MPTTLTSLLNKYSVPGGRYTYYPFHSQWKNNLNQFDWLDSITQYYDESKGIDLYIHIPFCQSLCTFCGCNIRITKSYQDISPYLNAIKNEWSLYQKLFDKEIKINTLYIGGGTPNFLHASDLDQLLTHFTNPNSTQISIELDPRYIEDEQLKVLDKHHVHTLSFGVQDLNPRVLENINREQTEEHIFAILEKAKSYSFKLINVDLIYGLTHQDCESLNSTILKFKNRLPDTFALYPFAKVPWQNNSQKAFGEFREFSNVEMNELFSCANNALNEIGYKYIGMGHFSLKDSINPSSRNIMGFTDKKSNILIGLGVSAFSSSPLGHIQNEKILEQYLLALQKNRLAIFKTHQMTPDEVYLSNLFEQIICQSHFSENDVSKILPNQLDNFKKYLDEGFIIKENDMYSISEQGKYFYKSICQCWG